MQQTIALLRRHITPAAAPARLGWSMRSFSSGPAAVNPFSHPEVRQEAIARWGLDYKGPTALVYPQGRPEVTALVKEAKSARIASGLYTQKKPGNSKDTEAAEGDGPMLARRKLDKDAPIWLKHRRTIQEKHGGEAWQPHRRLPRQTMEQIRYLRQQFPEEWTTPKLSSHFNISVESVNRILRSKFSPSEDRSRQQDMRRQEIKKARVAKSVEKMKTQRYLDWLRREATNPSPPTAPAKKPRSLSHIKLGAPKRD